MAAIGAGCAVVVSAIAQAAPADFSAGRQDEVEALNAYLRSGPSATEALRSWCADHDLAAGPTILARKRSGSGKTADANTLALLGDPAAKDVAFRHVALKCGSRVLSEADNWYRRDRLTPEMNHALETSHTPFGVVVRPLGFTRKTLNVWIAPHLEVGAVPAVVMRHRAVLFTALGQPFSVVVENHTRAVLGDLEVNPSHR